MPFVQKINAVPLSWNTPQPIEYLQGSFYKQSTENGNSLYTLFLDESVTINGDLFPERINRSPLFSQISTTQEALYDAIQKNYVRVEKSNSISKIMTALQSDAALDEPYVLLKRIVPNLFLEFLIPPGIIYEYEQPPSVQEESLNKFFFTDTELADITAGKTSSPLYDVMLTVSTDTVNFAEKRFTAVCNYLGLDNFLGKKRAEAIDQIQALASTLFAQNQSTLAEINKYNMEYGNLYNFIGQLAEAIRRMHESMLNLR